MRINKRALMLFFASLALVACSTVSDFEIGLPVAATPYSDLSSFRADRTVIPVGGCVTLAWEVPGAVRLVLRGSNWPRGTQGGVTPSGSTVVCPSAAAHYVANQPVRYTLTASYPDGHTDSREIVIRYEGAASAQPMPTATFDPNATPAGILVTPDADIAAVFQTFENGWMLWRGDTSTVFVLVGDGTLLAYGAGAVQPMPLDEPIPPGRVETHALLANVWRSWVGKSLVSTVIGWPTAPAQTYSARVFGQVAFGFGMTLPDGHYVNLSVAGAWYQGGMTAGNWTVSGAEPTFAPPSYPTLTPVPTATPSLVTAIYQEFERGFMVAAEDGDCAYLYAWTPDDLAGNIVIPRDMRLLNDAGSSYHYCVAFDHLPDYQPAKPAPSGLLQPSGAFGRIWNAYADVRDRLGYARLPEFRYIATVPAYPDTTFYEGRPWYEPVIALPDQRSLWCGFRSATAGTCTIQAN